MLAPAATRRRRAREMGGIVAVALGATALLAWAAAAIVAWPWRPRLGSPPAALQACSGGSPALAFWKRMRPGATAPPDMMKFMASSMLHSVETRSRTGTISR